jgi:hypothetical protein
MCQTVASVTHFVVQADRILGEAMLFDNKEVIMIIGLTSDFHYHP